MQFTLEDIRCPDTRFEINDWTFCQDLRQFFPALSSNHEIGEELKRRNVIHRDNDADCESACTWIYFRTEKQATDFISRLNEQPEISEYIPPRQLPSEVIVLTHEHFDLLKEFLKTLSEKQMKQYKALGLEFWEVEL